jgi:hypothetical protein
MDEHGSRQPAAGRRRPRAGRAGRDPRALRPPGRAAGGILDRVLPGAGPAKRAELAGHLAAFTDARVDRYWQLVGVINGWPPVPEHAPAFLWMIDALRSHQAA